MPAASYPQMLAAGIVDEGRFDPFNLYAGESDIVSDQAIAGATAIEQFRVCMTAPDNTIIPWDGSAGTASCIAAQPIPAAGKGPVFVGGIFNHAALIWPVGVATVEQRKFAFNRALVNLGVRKLL